MVKIVKKRIFLWWQGFGKEHSGGNVNRGNWEGSLKSTFQAFKYVCSLFQYIPLLREAILRKYWDRHVKIPVNYDLGVKQ